MKPERNKPTEKGKPKQKGKVSALKKRMLTAAHRERIPYTSPKLREIYSTKIEWVRLGKGATTSQIDKRSRRAERKRRS